MITSTRVNFIPSHVLRIPLSGLIHTHDHLPTHDNNNNDNYYRVKDNAHEVATVSISSIGKWWTKSNLQLAPH
jgi:hypothetical protein